MKKGLKIAIFLIGALVLIIGIGIIVFLSIPYKSDFETFIEMRRETLDLAGKQGYTPHPINAEFTDYRVSLKPLMALMFKKKDLGLTFKTFQSDKLERFSISQLEIGKGSGIFFDFTFMARPVPSINAPLFHCDILRPFPGTDGALYMDFYTLNDNTDLDIFFADEQETLTKARESVRKFWKNEGFGELTSYMESYKSRHRIEILEPKTKNDAERWEYYAAAKQCFISYLEAYLRSVENVPPSASREEADENRRAFQAYIKNLYENDIVVKLGYMIFDDDDFDRYFLDGFWGAN